MNALSAERLWVAPPGAEPVVRDFSLEIGFGEWVALSGPNGGGKSTLALALAGLRPLARGSVTLAPRVAANSRDRRRVAVILQDPSAQLFAGSVREEIAWTALNLGVPEREAVERAERWARRLGLERDLGLEPGALSAGRQQLVLIAAALASEPLLLIADEPGAHLDDRSRERVLEAVREEVARGLSVLWLTQSEREMGAADRRLWIGAPLAAAQSEAGGGPERRGPQGSTARMRVSLSAPERGPSIRLLAPLEITIPERGVLALLGPNAAGKSVLLSALTGLEAQPQVEVAWESDAGAPPLLVSQYPERQLFQEKVADELAYAAVSRGLSRAEVLDRAMLACQRLGLGPGILERRCWDLSSGERRLIEVVAGLIAPARLLALDEPTAGLDPGRREALASLVRERALQGPVVVAGQDPDWAQRLGAGMVRMGNEAEKGLPSISKKTD